MLAALFLAAVLSLDTCANCSSTGRDVKLCDPHALEERSTLAREAVGLKSKHSEAVIASLDAIAALTKPHANAPSAKVAQILAASLEHDSLPVRQRVVELLGPPQHAQVGLDALVRALADTRKDATRLRAEFKSLDSQLAGKLSDKRRETLTADRKACEERSQLLSQWQNRLTGRLVSFPDDRAVDAILDNTFRNLILNSDVALVRLGNHKALRALQESLDKAEENLADVVKELAEREAARAGQAVTLGAAMEGLVVDRLRATLVNSRRELATAFTERGLHPPAPDADSATWRTWIDQNLAAFPEHLPGINGAAW